MLELGPITTTTLARDSDSSMSSDTCSSFSRLSFDATTTLTAATDFFGTENLALKPHRSSDFAYSVIRSKKSSLTYRDFRLHRRIGSGDIGTVYLCSLRSLDSDSSSSSSTSCVYAMKVVDKEALALKKKEPRAEMERKILKMLDHPFLPTLYAEFEASHFSCIVMEYCSGGDLHSLRHKQPNRRFSLSSARFYAAEVLVALEYLHMLGIIYRDLKPENVLVRSDGHIMLSDFDLSLCSDAIPAVESPDSSPVLESISTPSYARPHPSTLTPFSCLSNRLFRSRKVQTLSPNRLFVAEPVAARSCSFVGTHEYVAPEVASGRSHGNAVDWWAFGIFLYEMIYGRTPFAAPSNETTLRSIVKSPLTFPTSTPCSALEGHARDLISGFLNKDPERRLGSKRGAADVKKHAFFKGINLALIRSLRPPMVPGLRRQNTTPFYHAKSDDQNKNNGQSGQGITSPLKNPSKPLINMARPAKKEVEAKKKPVVVEVKTQEKPSPQPSSAPQKPLSSAALANAFDLLDEDSSDLVSIVDAKEDDAFVAAERKRIEEEKKAARESKIKAREEEKKDAREAKKRAIQEKKVYEASILRFHSARPNLSFSRPSALASDGVQSQLAKNLSGLELQAKESQGAAVEQEAASVDGSSGKSSDGRRRANVNGSLRRKQKKKKKAEGEKKEGKDQQEKQDSNNGAPVVNSNYPRSYTLKEYEEKKKREEDEKNKKADAINNGMDHRQQRFDNCGQRRFANGGPRRFNNGGQRFDKQQALAEEAVVKDASFSLEDADFPVLAKQDPAVKAPAEEVVAGKAVVAKAPTGKPVAGKAVAKKSGAKKA